MAAGTIIVSSSLAGPMRSQIQCVDDFGRVRVYLFPEASTALGSGGGGSSAWGDLTGVPAAVTALTGTNTGDQDLSALAPLASPALTGTPSAPTATAGDDSTLLATTAFVQEAIPAPVTVNPASDRFPTSDIGF